MFTLDQPPLQGEWQRTFHRFQRGRRRWQGQRGLQDSLRRSGPRSPQAHSSQAHSALPSGFGVFIAGPHHISTCPRSPALAAAAPTHATRPNRHAARILRGVFNDPADLWRTGIERSTQQPLL